MKNFTLGFAAILMLAICATLLITGWQREEIHECLVWQSQAQEFQGFYLTHWQSEQCAFHQIPVAAPVK